MAGLPVKNICMLSTKETGLYLSQITKIARSRSHKNKIQRIYNKLHLVSDFVSNLRFSCVGGTYTKLISSDGEAPVFDSVEYLFNAITPRSIYGSNRYEFDRTVWREKKNKTRKYLK